MASILKGGGGGFGPFETLPRCGVSGATFAARTMKAVSIVPLTSRDESNEGCFPQKV